MSFFLESKRKTDFPITNNPSPFDYSVNPQRKKSKGYAPFNSTSVLNRGPNKKNKQQKQIQYEDDKVFVIDENNIQIMAQQRMQSMFKSRSQRIMYTPTNVPGPGTYQLRTKYKGKQNKHHQSLTHSGLDRKIGVPSIPTDNLGYKSGQNNELQKVQPKFNRTPVPGSYQVSKSLIKQRGIAWSTAVTISKKQDDYHPPGPGSYNYRTNQQKAPTSCFASQTDRFNPKKIKKSNMPGPGEYNVSQLRPFRQFSQSHFNSKASRFPIDKSSNLGPGSYLKQRNKSMKSFNQKALQNYNDKTQSNRKTIFTNMNNKNPGPGEYIARQGMTFQLQKALLRKHNLSQFPSSHREVFQVKDEDQPGPGTYNPTQPKGTQKGNIGYKKVEVINLKQGDDQITPSPLQYNYSNFTIAKKIENSAQRITLLTDKKPFNSGSERFQHYTNSKSKNNQNHRTVTYDTDNNQSVDADSSGNPAFEGPKRVKKLIMTSVKVKVPFGTSTSKYERQGSEDDIGPGSYDPKNKWIKQSYSIKSKLSTKI